MFKIKEREIGSGKTAYVIAEIGSNFDQSKDKAIDMIYQSAAAGAEMVKFQLFRAEALYPSGGELYDVFKSIELDASWLPDLIEVAHNAGLAFSASPFDLQSLQSLLDSGTDAVKIASSEATNIPLIEASARSGLPVLLSTGMCDLQDVIEAVAVLDRLATENYAVLQCGAVYPQSADQVHLNVLTSYKAIFDCPVGLSDHTDNYVAAVAAVSLGATIFEKHVTHDKKAAGPDHAIAADFQEFRDYVAAIREAEACLGSKAKAMLPAEREVGRREGVYLAETCKAGQILDADKLCLMRPAKGIRAKYFGQLVGQAILRGDLEAGSALTWNDITFIPEGN